MLLKIKILVLLLLFSLHFLTAQQNENSPTIIAQIKAVKKDNLVNIYAKVLNMTNRNYENLNYTLLTLKKDISGNISKNQQSGKFSIISKKNMLLDNVQLNISDKGNIKVFLYIRNNKELIAKDKVEITLIEKKYSNERIDEENIELFGLVVENVMTKLGKDFYDYFTQTNQLNAIKYPFIIVVNEKPSVGGRNSEINVMIDDESVYTFRTQPNEEYLNTNAVEANKRIYNYHLKRKLLKNKIRTF